MTPSWQAALRRAASMGIAPHAFWRLSLSEWRALNGAADSQPLPRSTLEDLQAKYPDGVI